jgi:hypothetical protein
MQNLLLCIPLLALLLTSCAPEQTTTPAPSATPLPTARASSTPTPTISPTIPATPAVIIIPVLPQEISWHIQYTGKINTALGVAVFNLDLFDTPSSVIEELHRHGVFVICYFSAGSSEDWRPDASRFPHEVLGKDLEGWPGEKWLDISGLDLLASIMEERLDLAIEKGCDGVDPDNVDGFLNDTGFLLSASDQQTYNIFLSGAAHSRGLAIGLKNDIGQILELLPYFDWVLNEECFTYQECDLLLSFIQSGKPVFVIEYELSPEEFCPQANQMGFNALHKHWELDAYYIDCHEFSADQ